LPHELVLSDYPEALEVVREQTFVVEDDFERQGLSDEERRNSAALAMRAMVASTARKGKGTPLWSMAAVSSQPRRWTPDEIALVEEAAERTWAAVERARAETALRDSETRQAFLLDLSDALRPLADAADIKRTAAILLGRHLGVDRAFWSEMVQDEWLIDDAFEPVSPSLAPGRYPAGVYGRWTMDSLKAGLTAAISDTAHDARLRPPERDALRDIGVAAVIGVPLLRDGEVVATLSVHSHKPRAWTEEELELVQETADRTWPAVERARTEAVLRDSEGRFRALAEASPLGVAVTDVNKSIIVYANRAYETIIGYDQNELEGQPSTSVYYDPADRSWLAEMRETGRITGHEVRFRRKDGSPVWVSINVAPINFGGRPAIIGVVQDISAGRDASNAEQRDPDA
jgi:PAS domain S-box-containing protein